MPQTLHGRATMLIIFYHLVCSAVLPNVPEVLLALWLPALFLAHGGKPCGCIIAAMASPSARINHTPAIIHAAMLN